MHPQTLGTGKSLPNSRSPIAPIALVQFLRSLPNSVSVVSPPQPGSERPRLFTAAPRSLFAGSSASGSSQDPAAVPTGPQASEAHARVHTRAHTPRSHSGVLDRCTPPSAGWRVGVTSGLQSRGERLERAARSSPRKLEVHWGSSRSRAPPSPLHPLSRCPPWGSLGSRQVKVGSEGGRRGCCSPGRH